MLKEISILPAALKITILPLVGVAILGLYSLRGFLFGDVFAVFAIVIGVICSISLNNVISMMRKSFLSTFNEKTSDE